MLQPGQFLETLSDLNSFLVSGRIVDGITIDNNNKTAFFRIESRRKKNDATDDDAFTIDYFDIQVPPRLFDPVPNCALIGRKVRVVAALFRCSTLSGIGIEVQHIEYLGTYCDECHKEIDTSRNLRTMSAWGNCTDCGDDLCEECVKKRGGFDENGRCGRCHKEATE